MKITRKSSGVRESIANLSPGATFRFDRQLYILTTVIRTSPAEMEAVNLRTGEPIIIRLPQVVSYVQAKVVLL